MGYINTPLKCNEKKFLLIFPIIPVFLCHHQLSSIFPFTGCCFSLETTSQRSYYFTGLSDDVIRKINFPQFVVKISPLLVLLLYLLLLWGSHNFLPWSLFLHRYTVYIPYFFTQRFLSFDTNWAAAFPLNHLLPRGFIPYHFFHCSFDYIVQLCQRILHRPIRDVLQCRCQRFFQPHSISRRLSGHAGFLSGICEAGWL